MNDNQAFLLRVAIARLDELQRLGSREIRSRQVTLHRELTQSDEGKDFVDTKESWDHGQNIDC